jgi:hypothetical protein
MMYRILWDNGHASGALAGEFNSKRAAECAARAWKREMVAIEPAADRGGGRGDGSWEIVDTTTAAA